MGGGCDNDNWPEINARREREEAEARAKMSPFIRAAEAYREALMREEEASTELDKCRKNTADALAELGRAARERRE